MSDTDTETNEPRIETDDPTDAVADAPTNDAAAGQAATDVRVDDDSDIDEAADTGSSHDEVVTDEPGAVSVDASPEAEGADVPPDAEAAVDVSPEVEGTEASPDAEGDVITDEELLERPRLESPYDRPGRWFVVHTQSGYEKKVKQNLEARIVSMNAEDAIYEVVIPMEDYVDFRNGKRIVAQRKMFPGYLLVRAELDDQAWFVIRNTPGVTGFVGQGAKPSPLPRRDVESFLMPKGGTEEQAAQRAKPRLEYEIGETVRVREGPFADFSGEVIELNEDQLKLKVLVNIFGRETPVELEFSKVAKL
jgi:transcription termination/antitermination protein NusG